MLRGVSRVGWVLAGTWLVVLVLGSAMAWSRGDEHDVLFGHGWWGWLAATCVVAVVGELGRALSRRFSREALGDHADEIRIVDTSFTD